MNKQLIKEHYDYLTPLIMKASIADVQKWTSPYSGKIDWVTLFTPIEMDAWEAIRGFGMAPLYPQYPVDNYLLDFGNPFVKVALECDGAAFHTDKEKDNARDLALLQQGWITYRITGSDCHRIDKRYQDITEDDHDYLEVVNEYYSSSIEGLIQAIAMFHFNHDQNFHLSEVMAAKKCLELRAIPSKLLTKAIAEGMTFITT